MFETIKMTWKVFIYVMYILVFISPFILTLTSLIMVSNSLAHDEEIKYPKVVLFGKTFMIIAVVIWFLCLFRMKDSPKATVPTKRRYLYYFIVLISLVIVGFYFYGFSLINKYNSKKVKDLTTTKKAALWISLIINILLCVLFIVAISKSMWIMLRSKISLNLSNLNKYVACSVN